MPRLPDFSAALRPGVRRRELFAWACYDFANSGYTTVVLTAVFNAYFVAVIAAGRPWATLAWTGALSLSYLLVIVFMPLIGAEADRRAAKRRLLAASTIACVLSSGALALVGPGEVALAVLLIVLSNFAYSVGESLCAAFLPELARPSALGRVSGWAWSFGYCGGMLTLGASLAWVLHAQASGASAAQAVPPTLLITAGIFAAAALPTFALLRERATPSDRTPASFSLAWRELGAAWRHARGYPAFARFLLCSALYQSGIAVVITLAAVYAEQVMHFSTARTMLLVFLVNIAAALGAFGFGHLQDALGHRRTLTLTLLGWIAMVLLAGLGESEAGFWAAAALAGLCMGSSQSAGRALVGALAPASHSAEFFGLWAVATRVAGILGPMSYGTLAWASGGNHRLAILCTGLFFVAGLLVLRSVDDKAIPPPGASARTGA